VDFFFVLSGFIIFHAHGGDHPGRGPMRTYLTKRAIRIYPPYWPIGLVMLLAAVVAPQLSEAGAAHHPSIISSFLLLPTGPTALSVAWTLVWEIMFYLTFCLFFLWRRAFAWIMAVWAVAVLAAIVFNPDLAGRPEWSPLGAHNIEFLAGMAVAWMLRRATFVHRSAVRWITGLSGFAMLAAALTREVAGLPKVAPAQEAYLVLYMAVAFALILLCISQLQLNPRARLLRAPIFLGSASYAVYLVHDPALSVLNRVVRIFFSQAPAPALFIGVVLLATLAGCLYHLIVERPLIQSLSSRLGVRAARAVTSYAPAR
jgi:peptidoglycan/LPS O-acetylase OafA/YrhL